MENRAMEVSNLQDIPAVRIEIEAIAEWLDHQDENKVR
jgi:hypothetical protein